MQSNHNAARGAPQRPQPTKLPWKKSASGNAVLSFYGLKVTVFHNRRGNWSVAITQNGGTPAYQNFATEAQARAYAEQQFLALKDNGQFGPPKPPSLCEVFAEIERFGSVPEYLTNMFVEIEAVLEHEGERATLFRFEEDGKLYWVPKSQHIVAEEYLGGGCRIVVSQWWHERAEATQ